MSWNSIVAFSTSVMNPKLNRKVVIPSRDILYGDKEKPGLLLKATYRKRASSFSSKAQLTRGRRPSQRRPGYRHLRSHMHSAMAQKIEQVTASLLSLTICDSDKEVLVHCRFGAGSFSQGISRHQAGHGGKIEWAGARLENNWGMQNLRGIVEG